MLKTIQIQRYKSLYDVTLNLEPLTVFIGPNGSGKSSICEGIFVFSQLTQGQSIQQAVNSITGSAYLNWQAKLWRGQTKKTISFGIPHFEDKRNDYFGLSIAFDGKTSGFNFTALANQEHLFQRAIFYNFDPARLAQNTSDAMSSTGLGIANTLSSILYDSRERFSELEKRFTGLIPNVSLISLDRDNNRNDILRLVDKYSGHIIPAFDISDGTLRILGFLTALYQVDTPDIICFEEPENGIHPWLLGKIMELLHTVSTEGIGGKPVQILITTHSPTLLNYVKPEQVRVVELDHEGKTQVHPLPTESPHLQAAMKAYENQIGEMWFSDIFGGNPT